MRTDASSPYVFEPSSRRSPREILKTLQAQEVFQVLLPAIGGEFPPQEILRIREEVRDTREGFAMHLQSLSAEVQKGLQADASLSEIARVASAVVETKLLPDYAEFRRQLAAKNQRFFGKLLDPLGKILAIDAVPWTPKFWGTFLSALGSAFGLGAEDDADRLSNKQQALHFMRIIENTQKDR